MLKGTKTTLLTGLNRKKLINTSHGHHRSPGNTRDTSLEEFEQPATLRSTETLPGLFGVWFEG